MSARLATGLLAFFAIAVLVWVWVIGEEPAARPSASEAFSSEASIENGKLAEEIVSLRTQLKRESNARKELAEQLALLRLELETSGALDPNSAEPGRAGWEGAPLADAEELDTDSPPQEDEESEDMADQEALDDGSSEKPGFDSAGLIAAGLHPQEAAELRERWEEFWLDHLYMVDQAKREGWRYKPRYWREASILERELLDELGEESFDQMLYASGRPNRVIVRDVLQGSAAERAGLLPGDTIVRYNDRPVFDTRKLQTATARGKFGRSVRIEVMRGDNVVVLDIDRGPLGTVLRADTAEPFTR